MCALVLVNSVGLSLVAGHEILFIISGSVKSKAYNTTHYDNIIVNLQYLML